MSCASKVAYTNTTVYVVGGFTIIRSSSDPDVPSQELYPGFASSHLYTLSLAGSSTIDLSATSGRSTLFNPPPQRLPDQIPRVIWGNFYQRQGKLYLFGGVRTPYPIFLPNGTEAGSNPKPGAQLFTYDISSATWLSDELQSGIGYAITEAATAYDPGREVFWMYGGATYQEPYNYDSIPLEQEKNLWKAPGAALSDPDCVVSSTDSRNSAISGACQVNTTTAPSAKVKPTTRGTMVFIEVGMSTSSRSPGSEGILLLLGGREPVCHHIVQ